MNFNSLSKRPRNFMNFTSLSVSQFKELVELHRENWERLTINKKKQVFRQRKMGGGRKLKINNLEDRILIFITYTKYYLSYFFMEQIFGVDESTICRIVKEISILLSKELIIDKDRKRISSLKELINEYPEIANIIIDATEQKFNTRDNDFYSGKRGMKTIKTQIVTDNKGRILFVDNPVPGRMHDYEYLKKSCIPKWLTRNKNEIKILADLGYQGIYKDFPYLQSKIPFKKIGIRKELNDLEKEENKKISKKRIVIEHAFGRLKKFKILGESYHNSLQNYSNFFKSIAFITNFRMLSNS